MPMEISPLLRRCLDATIAELTEEFRGVFGRETVTRYIEESFEQIGDRPTVGPNFLPVIIDVSLASACGPWRSPRAGSRSRYRKCCSSVSTTPGAARSPRRWPTSSPTAGSGFARPGLIRTRRSTRLSPQVMSEISVDVALEFPQPLTDEVVRAADVVVTLGCGDACPVYPGKRYQDWPVADPGGRSLEVVREIRYELYHHVWELLETLVPTGDLIELHRSIGGQP